MTDNERNTHFQGFAKLLMKDLLGDAGYIDVHKFWDSDEIAIYEEIIANRAYDLVEHTLDSMRPDVYWGSFGPEKSATDIPDLTQWPESPTPETD